MAIGSDVYDSLDKARRGGQRSHAVRGDFEVDKGRIVHSAAFRRLQGKTQVLGVGERDFYRTRLTHSLEVAQLARGMCFELRTVNKFRPDPDLVEAISLAHDIGHPPFGHSGEDFLNAKMAKFGGFGANPQNIRIVTFLEAKFKRHGLDLTRACIDGLMKYPDLYDKSYPELKEKTPHEDPKFTYSSQNEDIKLFSWVKEGVSHPEWVPVESKIADLADQMAYSVNDIEDSIRAGLFNPIDMLNRAEEISDRAKKKLLGIAVKEHHPRNDVPKITSPAAIKRMANELQAKVMEPKDYRIRKVNLKAWTSKQIKKMKKASLVQRSKTEPSVRYRYDLKVDLETHALIQVLKSAVALLVFSDPRVTTLEEKGHHIIGTLFDVFSGVAEDKAGNKNEKYNLMPIDFRQMIDAKVTTKERLIADFISGMTDRYAYHYYSRLFQPGVGSFYEDV